MGGRWAAPVTHAAQWFNAPLTFGEPRIKVLVMPSTDAAFVSHTAASAKAAFDAARTGLRAAEQACGGLLATDHPAQVEYMRASKVWGKVGTE